MINLVINAENSSLKCDRFTLPNSKARQSILKTLIDAGLEANQVARSFGNHSRLNGEKKYYPSGAGNGERPKSAGAQQQHISSVRGSFKSNNTLLVSTRSITPELPPVPSISRSGVLRDLKSLTRRKSGAANPRPLNQKHNNNSTSAIVLRQQHLPPIQKNDGSSDEKEGTTNVRNRRVSCINHYQAAERRKMLEPLCETSASTISVASTTMPGSGIRYKAHNLMNTMIGRRNSRTGLPHSS